MILAENLEFALDLNASRQRSVRSTPLREQLVLFRDFGEQTRCEQTKATTFSGAEIVVDTFINEFWTAKQRAAASLHEISYRACFKPQLPRFFIQRLTDPGDVVYDPFMGRGTTLIEGALLDRIPYGCDVNPLSRLLVKPRLHPVAPGAVEERLRSLDLRFDGEIPEDLLVFYHPHTLREICALRQWLIERREAGTADPVDDWITMIALNRLTGHSAGFFSVYTMPPNQAVSVVSQRKINAARNQVPPQRDVRAIICKKTRNLLSDSTPGLCDQLRRLAASSVLVTSQSSTTPEIPSNSVSLVVTSPPFLDVVDYAGDNWLRCWFAGIDVKAVKITTPKKLEAWQAVMTDVFRELFRVLKPGGHIAFEVGEVKRGSIKLEHAVVACGVEAGLEPLLILINAQEFTKTANCWGVDNNAKGTNSNRIVVFRKA